MRSTTAEEETAAAADSSIDVFLRIRPSKNPSTYFERDEIDDNKIRCKVPVNDTTFVNNSRSHYEFEFNGVIDTNASQNDVYKTIGVPACNNVFDGYNSTIFAYGECSRS